MAFYCTLARANLTVNTKHRFHKKRLPNCIMEQKQKAHLGWTATWDTETKCNNNLCAGLQGQLIRWEPEPERYHVGARQVSDTGHEVKHNVSPNTKRDTKAAARAPWIL